jgi:hypothetical protein
MKDWLEENPDGTKDSFERYFKALPADVRKVSNHSNFPFPPTLTRVACSHTRTVLLQL